MPGVRKQCSWAQWYSGSECTSMSSPVISPSVTQDTYWAIRLRWVSIAPLGLDSVPLV